MAVCPPKSLFNSLEKLEFEDMPEWKQWNALEFPKLENLSIGNCAKLMGKLPENLCSLIRLRISGCPELSLETPIQLSSLKRFEVIGFHLFDEAQLLTSQLEGMKQIVELCIEDCNSLTSLPFSILPCTLENIKIFGCQKLKLEAPVGHCNMFLENLELEKCDCIYGLSPELLPRARELRVKFCDSITRFLIPPATERLHILVCQNVEIFLVACGGAQMTYLHISNCLKLKCLPEGMPELLPSLKQLRLWSCPEIESFPEGGLPFNLQKLGIDICTKLVNGRKAWRLPRLRMLVIKHDGSDEDIEHWELPCSIQILEVCSLKTLSSQVLKFTSLERLHILDNLPQIQSLLEEGQLPSSLSQLLIWNFPNLQSLSESALPSSLSHLTIWNCPNLQSLPVKGMPSSLSKLSISNCPLLKPQLEFDKGEYWPKIAQIPNIQIDLEFL